MVCLCLLKQIDRSPNYFILFVNIKSAKQFFYLNCFKAAPNRFKIFGAFFEYSFAILVAKCVEPPYRMNNNDFD